MAKTRDILTHVSLEIAVRKRICHHNRNQHEVAKDERCLVVKDAATGAKKNYCRQCALDILQAASTRIALLRAEL